MKRTYWSEQSSNEREHDLKRASEFHAVLLGMAGHYLRQPLHVIQSTYERLSHAVDNDAENVQLRQRELLRRGESAVAKLTEQLDRLAGALRLYEYTSRMELSAVPLAPLFDSVWAEGVEPAWERGVHLRVRPTAAVVMSNALLLDGIVRNLVRNAIKYTPASGRVLLACRARGDHMRIDVYDTGVGVSAI
jgi:two-component system, OmpR family, phosphate regulon sensor histidine kinase PhoR